MEVHDNFLNQIRIHTLSDKQLITLALAADSFRIDLECYLFKQPTMKLVGQINRSVFDTSRFCSVTYNVWQRLLFNDALGYFLFEAIRGESHICTILEFELSSSIY